jgi:hypothetical protein
MGLRLLVGTAAGLALGAALALMRPPSASGYGLDTQTIIWDVRPANTTYGYSQTVRAHSDKGYAVYFSASGPCSVSGMGSGTVRATGVGTCTITAYAPTLPVVAYAEAKASFSIYKASQTVSIGAGIKVAIGQSVAIPVTSSSGLTPFLWSTSTPAICSAYTNYGQYWVTGLAAGDCKVSATQAGNSNYYSAVSPIQTVKIVKLNQTVSISSASTVGVDRDISVTVSSTSGLTVYLTSTNPAVCTITADASGLKVRGVAAGTCYITASQAGDGTYNPASKSQQISVTPSAQTVSIDGPTSMVFGQDFAFSVTSDVGLTPFTWESLTQDTCTAYTYYGQYMVHAQSFGPCTVRATQAGNSNYNPATKDFPLNIDRASQTITFPAIPDREVVGSPDIALDATASSGLPVSYQIYGQCQPTSQLNVVHITAAGSCTITAYQPGTNDINAAAPVTHEIITIEPEVNIGSASLSWGQEVPVSVTTNLTSSAIAWESTTRIRCSAETRNGQYWIKGLRPGNCVMKATLVAYPSETREKTFHILKLNQIVTIQSDSIIQYGETITVAISSDSGLDAFVLSTSTEDYCTTSTSGPPYTIHADSVGTCEVSATEPGDDFYNEATATGSILIGRANQTINIGSPSVAWGQDVAIPVSSSANLTPFTWESTTPDICTAYTNYGLYWVHGIRPGDCQVQAWQAGNDDYYPQTQAGTIKIAKKGQTISVDSGGSEFVRLHESIGVSIRSDSGRFSFTVKVANENYCSIDGIAGAYSLYGKLAGPCTISITEEGDEFYDRATASWTVSIDRVDQTVTIPSGLGVGVDREISLPISSTSGLTSFNVTSMNPDVCTTSADAYGWKVRGKAAGTCKVTATQAGDDTYKPGTGSQSISVTSSAQTVTIGGPTSMVPGQDIAYSVTSSAGLTDFIWESLTPTICSAYTEYGQYWVHDESPGTCTVRASQPGNSEYMPKAAEYQISMQLSQTVTVPSGLVVRVGERLTVTGIQSTSGLANFQFEAVGDVYCEAYSSGDHYIDGRLVPGDYWVQGKVAGTCTVLVTQPGNNIYESRNALLQITVSKFDQTIAFPTILDRAESSPDVTLDASASSGLPIALQVSGQCQATSELNVVHITGVGSCTITAYQPGDDTYNAAAPVTQVFRITEATITIGSASVAYGQDVAVTVTSNVGPASFTWESLTPSICRAHTDYGQYWIEALYPGTCRVKAALAGDYSVHKERDFTIPKLNQEVTISSGHAVGVGEVLVVPISSTSGLGYFEFTTSTPDSCTASTVGGNPYEYKIHAIKVGPCEVAATQPGDSMYNPSDPAPGSFSIGKGYQTITIGSKPVTLGQTVALPVSSSAGLTPFAWVSMTEGTCTVSAAGGEYQVTAVAVGTCTVQATQPGNDDYNSATATSTFTINEGQVITIGSVRVAYGQTVVIPVWSSVPGLTHFTWTPKTATCSVNPYSGAVTGLAPGECTLTVTEAGNAEYASASAETTFPIEKADHIITIPSGLVVGVGQNLTVPISSDSGQNMFEFTSTNPDYCVASATYDSQYHLYQYQIHAMQPGTCYVSATESGNVFYNSTTVLQSISVNRLDQAITFPKPDDRALGSPDFALEATASSGLPVSYEISGPCQATSALNVVHITGPGACIITAYQLGDDTYSPATAVTLGVQIDAPKITVGSASLAYGQKVAIVVSSSASLPITWSSLTPTTCRAYEDYGQYWIEGLYPGECRVRAALADYNSVYEDSPLITILKLSPTIYVATLGPSDEVIATGLTVGVGGDVSVPISSDSGLVTDLTTTTPNICTPFTDADGWRVRGKVVGECDVIATQAGNEIYKDASSGPKSIWVDKGSQTITIGSKPVTLGQTVALPVSSSAGLTPFAWVSMTEGTCTVSAAGGEYQVTAVAVGTCTVQATQPGNDDYNSATATSTFTINYGQVITIGSVRLAYGQTVVIPVSSSVAGLTHFTWTPKTATCSVNPYSGAVTGLAPGECTLTVTEAGNAEYASASAETTFTIEKADQIITLAPKDGSGDPGLVVGVGRDLDVTIASDSGLNNFFVEVTNPDYCTISQNVHDYSVRGKRAGTCDVSVTEPYGNDFYKPTTASWAISVNKLDQTITFPAIADRVVGSPDFTLDATASSGLPVSYQVSGHCLATSELNVVHITDAGTCTIKAYQLGDDTFNAATPVTQTFQINAATPPPPKPVIYDPSLNEETNPYYPNEATRLDVMHKALADPEGAPFDLDLHFKAEPDFPITFSVEGQCTLNDHLVIPTNPQFGSCYVTAQAGPDPLDPRFPYYSRSEPVTRVIKIGTLGQRVADTAIGQIGNSGCYPNPGEPTENNWGLWGPEDQVSPPAKSWTPWGDHSDAFVDSGDWSYFWRAAAKDKDHPAVTKSRYGGSSCQGNQWCALFASWVRQQVVPNSPYEWDVIAWKSYATSNGMWTDAYPAVGDLVTYTTPSEVGAGNPEGLVHVAVVTDVYWDGTFEIVGGNQDWKREVGGIVQQSIYFDHWPYSRNAVSKGPGNDFPGYSVRGFVTPLPVQSTVGVGQVAPGGVGLSLAAAPTLWLVPFGLWLTGRTSETRRRSRRRVRRAGLFTGWRSARTR